MCCSSSSGFFQDTDVGKVSVAALVVQAVADDKFIGDLEADVIGPDFLGALFVFCEEDGGVDSGGAFICEAFADSGKGAAGIEDIVEKQDVFSPYFREYMIEEIHFARAFEAAMVACYIEALDGELAGDSSQEVGGEDECAFEQDDDEDGAFREVAIDFTGDGFDAPLDDGFIDEHSFDILLHGHSF